ncbi:STAS domain-containing protein [Micromonospora soli]|uniref:STAS domain-containing protein n=1 Tax=Micromonospora sp. NBRC 110009 TaxID=3061627 RepID=UPI0026715800|nr:STAS domain-containing protein [Micromonospora sp. NBRC 110009]WKT97320.1 STAS domain-containing protein [Micromonospora sp. NBRC 110009]
MTVVPADNLMTLICDGCGDTVTGTGCTLPDAEVVWTLVFDNDWVRSPFASGPHHCPRCSARTGPDGDGGLDIDYLDEVGGEPTAQEPDLVGPVRRALAESVTFGDRMLVDLAEVEVLDSAGLGLLVRARQQARQDGRRLCLVAPSRFVLTVLHTMRLDGVFPVFDSRTRALSGPVGPGPAPPRPDGTEPAPPPARTGRPATHEKEPAW